MTVDRDKLRKWLIGDFNLRRLARSILETYLLLLVFAYFFTDLVIFQPPPSRHVADPDTYRVSVNDSEQIEVLALTNSQAKYTVLYSHGNAEDISDVKFLMEDYRKQGYAVFTFDYRGYGNSDGRPSTSHAYEDAEAAFQSLVHDRGIPPDQIILHGRSVGAAFAIYLAAQHKVAGLIAESPFLTAFRVRTNIPIAPFDKMRNNKWIQQVRCPVLIMHGEADQTIPSWHGRKLFELAHDPKMSYWAPKGDHNDLLAVDETSYWASISKFRSALDH